MAAPIETCVDNFGEVEELIKKVELTSSLKFVCLRRTKNFGSNNAFLEKDIHKLSWSDSTNVIQNDMMPFIRMGHYERGCMFGRDKHAKDKRLRREQRQRALESDHPAPKQKVLLQPTKKKGCKACIQVKEVIVFPQFKSPSNSKKVQSRLGKELKKTLASGVAVQTLHRFYVKLPDADCHNHTMSPLIGMVNPISDEVKDKIMSLVMIGVTSVSEMRRHLKEFVGGISPAPLQTNLAYYPMDTTIRKHMSTCQQRLRFSKLDQENVIQYVVEYTASNPCDNMTFVPAAAAENNTGEYNIDEIHQDDEDEVISTTSKPINSSVFFCHQTQTQRQLLRRYGNDICLLDATYRTTKYALPLFFLAVPTNVGYMVVGEFIVENESTASIQQGLDTLKRWVAEDEDNRGWRWEPQFFMTDFCEAEINALEMTFRGSTVLLCDFHREQSWSRWLSKSSNGLTGQKEQVTVLLRRCAHAIDKEEYNRAVSQLQQSLAWKEHEKLRNWFSRKWIPEAKRWVWAFRLDRRVMVNTNNGIEKQNKDFKYSFLEQKKTNSLAGMINTLVTEYLPSKMKRYMRDNITASQSYGRLYQNVPLYLHDRPSPFVRHCLDKIQLAQYIDRDEVVIHEHCFKVRSQSDGHTDYEVMMDNGNGQPHCTCRIWLWERLPCKHMFAVISHHSSWESLPLEFRESPFFTLDDNVLSLAPTVEQNTPTVMGESDHLVDSFMDLPAPKQHKSQVNKLSAQCREQLSLIRNNTYLCRDQQVLQMVHSQLKETADYLLQHLKCNADFGIIEETEGPSKKQRPSTRNRSKGSGPTVLSDQMDESSLIGDQIDEPSLVRDQMDEPTALLDEGTILNKALGSGPTVLSDQMDESSLIGDQIDEPSLVRDQMDEPTALLDEGTILNKALEFKQRMSRREWDRMVLVASITRCLTSDEVSETAQSILVRLEDRGIVLLKQLYSLAPNMPDSVMNRLGRMIIYQLVKEGKVWACDDCQNDVPEISPQLDEESSSNKGTGKRKECGDKTDDSGNNTDDMLMEKKTGSENNKKVRFETSVTKSVTRETDCVPFGGLPNPARMNICFANSLLQCLRTTDITKLLSCHTECVDPCFVCQLKLFFEAYPALSSLGLCKKMQDFWPEYKIGSQQDAHELFQKLMEELHREMGPSDHYSTMFQGELEYTISCCQCKKNSKTIETYNNLSLSMKNTVSLQQALSGFFDIEHMAGFCCRSCKKAGGCKRSTQLIKVPRHLVLHLKRFNMATRSCKKDQSDLLIGENIELKTHVKPQVQNMVEYKGTLTAVLVHYGTMTAGHYYCYVRRGLQWYKVDDTNVRRIQMSPKLLGEAYMLVYKMLPRPYI